MHIEADARHLAAARATLGELLSDGLRSLRSGAERASASLSVAASRGRSRAEEAAARLRRSAPLRHALAAAKRGNPDAALALLKEAVEREPGDAEAVLAFWELALGAGRAAEAAAALARQIHTEASAGSLDLAVDHWIALSEHAPAQHADAPTLVRMLPELRRRLAEAEGAQDRARAEDRLLLALRQSVEPEASQLTTGLALRVFAQARLLDPEAARRAGEIVLAARDLHEAKRREVETLLAALDERAGSERAECREASDSTAAMSTTEVLPIELRDRGLIVREAGSGERTRIDLRNVAAIAAACIAPNTGEADAKLPLLIDLVLRRTPRARGRRIVRIDTDAFDPQAVLGELGGSGDPSRTLLQVLIERSGAVPLLEAGESGGLAATRFASVDAYEDWLLSHLDAGRPG